MRYTSFVASGMGLAVMVFAALAAVACVQDVRNPASGGANGDGREGARAGSGAATREPTAGRGERGILTGVITDGESSCLVRGRPCRRILVEEDPYAECGGNRGALAPGCDKTYFDVTRETDVFRKVGDTREAAPVADLRKGLRVSADSAGYPVMESYPSQTRARAVEILDSPRPHDEGRAGQTRIGSPAPGCL